MSESNDSSQSTAAIDKPIRHFFRASAAVFEKIPGSPIAYWVSKQVGNAFQESEPISNYFPVNPGIRTGKDEWFLRLWFEVSKNNTQFELTNSNQIVGSNKWFPLHKGGNFRKWYGNAEHVIDLFQNGRNIKTKSPDFRLREKEWYFKPFVSWSRISSADIAFRYFPYGVLFSDAGPGIFAEDKCLEVMSLLNSKLGNLFLKIINPTLNYQKQDVESVPYIRMENQSDIFKAVGQEKEDWDSYENSWEFSSLHLLQHDYRQSTLKLTYKLLRAHWREMTLEMQRLEEKNNRIFIDAYGLQDELKSDVPLNEITLTCNPHYRYGNNKKEEELETLLLADTMKEFISYGVGCMFGRYSLDKPGLILANQGETIEDYYEKISNHEKHELHEKENNENFRDFRAFRGSCLFPADEDNVIPMLDGDWFTDDITDHFCKFLKVTFGEEHYQENLTFIEKALGKDIRKYFLKDFYNDHLKRYKKRPIYWLFSSPKGTFNALIYMYRYRPDTVSVVLNDYLREFRTKLSARKNHLEAVSISANASPSEKTKALKEIESLKKMIDELDTYEREVLYPLATEQVEIDLDDGVKVNYQKFGEALKKIPGLAAKDEE